MSVSSLAAVRTKIRILFIWGDDGNLVARGELLCPGLVIRVESVGYVQEESDDHVSIRLCSVDTTLYHILHVFLRHHAPCPSAEQRLSLRLKMQSKTHKGQAQLVSHCRQSANSVSRP